jgi:flagellar motility protein MotE (MotC chaperone)
MTWGIALRDLLQIAALSAIVLLLGPSSHAQSGKDVGAAEVDPAPVSELQQFCTNNAASASDARIAWQSARLGELETRIGQRLKDLEAKRLEVAEWLRKRDDALRQASETIVAIYARMRPESAALQLGAMDDNVAAAILAKLPARAAGVILNEMDAGRAAKVTRSMVEPTSVPPKKANEIIEKKPR